MTQPMKSSQHADRTVAHSLDCRGLKCPMPIYKSAMAMKQLEPGQILEIICTDPGSLADFPAFAKQGRHELLSSEEQDGVQTFHIRKRED